MPIFWATPRFQQSSLGCSNIGLHFESQNSVFQFDPGFETQNVIQNLNILNSIAEGEE